mgnify:CR=1 FL=1
MAIRIKTDLDFGQVWYIKYDPDQFEHQLVGLVVLPGNQFKFRLSYMGEISELYDFECSQEKNIGIIKED